MDNPPRTVLVADDDEDMRVLVRAVLSGAGLDVVAEAIDGADALAALERLDPPPIPSVLVLDNRMPGLSGLEVAGHVLQRLPWLPIVLFGAFLTPEIEQQARQLGIRACVSKKDVGRLPAVIGELVST